MGSRKQLKKSVKRVTGELFADCVVLSRCTGADTAHLQELMKEVIDIHTDYVARISHTDKAKAKAYYAHFKTEFTKKVNDLSERIIHS